MQHIRTIWTTLDLVQSDISSSPILFYRGVLCYQLYQAPKGTLLPDLLEQEDIEDVLMRTINSNKRQMFSQMPYVEFPALINNLMCDSIFDRKPHKHSLRQFKIKGPHLEIWFRCCKLL